MSCKWTNETYPFKHAFYGLEEIVTFCENVILSELFTTVSSDTQCVANSCNTIFKLFSFLMWNIIKNAPVSLCSHSFVIVLCNDLMKSLAETTWFPVLHYFVSGSNFQSIYYFLVRSNHGRVLLRIRIEFRYSVVKKCSFQ